MFLSGSAAARRRPRSVRTLAILGCLLALYGEDGHPTAAGTYLAACVIYATLLGKSPVGTPYAPTGLSSDQRDFLQRIPAQGAGY